jgi:hypothetical protein
MTRPGTGSALAALAWAAAVVAATAVGMSAVGAIGSGILGAGQEPLTSAEVDRALASARAAPLPAPAPTSAATPADPTGLTEVIPSPGGTVVARCAGGAVEVVSAAPAQGFRLDDEQEHSRVRFESEETDVDVELTCRDGRPVGVVEVDD